MKWWEMPETTVEERAKKEIAECNHCINGLVNTMKQMKVPKKDYGKNVMVKAYLERIEKAREVLKTVN